MLALNTRHAFHVAGAVHAPAVYMEEKNDGACNRKNGKNPSCPGSFQTPSCAKYLNRAQTEQNRGKRFMLSHSRMFSQPVQPGLRSEWTKLRVTEDQHKNPCQ